jgi:hypothetical protein
VQGIKKEKGTQIIKVKGTNKIPLMKMHDILECTSKAKCKMIHMTPRDVTSRSYLFLLLCQYPAGDIAISFIVTCSRGIHYVMTVQYFQKTS